MSNVNEWNKTLPILPRFNANLFKNNTDEYYVFISVCNTIVNHEEKLKTLLNLNDSFCWKTKHNTLFKCTKDSMLLKLDYRKLDRIMYSFNCKINQQQM